MKNLELIKKENLTKKENSIYLDLLELQKENLNITTLIDDIKDDENSYNYFLNDLEIFLIKFNLK